MSADLSRLLRPKSIAVFGGGWAANVVEQLLKSGFGGDIWPVSPTRDSIHGVTTFPSITALPGVPDAAWIGVNRDATIEVVRELRERGAGGAVCFASGFRETEDGDERNAALLEAAQDMPIIGPNCYGALNYLDGATLWPDQHGGKRVGKGVAILTQSSNMAINMTMQRRGLPIAYTMTAGNQAQIGLAEMAASLLDDRRVTAIGLHVEGVGDTAAFEELVRKAREKRIPVIALKIGRSEQAQSAAVSHTASLAGSDAGSRAFFRRLGVPLVASVPAFIETLKLLHVYGALPGRDILSMSCSGGEASLMADTAENFDLSFRPYTPDEKAAISETLNPMVTVANPLDYHTFIWGDEAALTETFSAAMQPGFDLSMLVLDFPREDRCSVETWEPAVQGIIAASRRTNGRCAVIASLGELLPEERCEQFIGAGLVPFCGIDEAMIATDAAAQIYEAWGKDQPAPILPIHAPTGASVVLSEADSKARLARYGLAVPESRIAGSGEEAVSAAGQLGYPVVLKATGIAHKTEQNAVRLNLKDSAAVSAAAEELLRLSNTLLIERMVQGGLTEMILGISRDPAYGLMLTIGAGGVLAELLQDSVTLLLPTNDADLREAILSLKIARLLVGWRGGAPADLGGLISAALALARFAEDHADKLEEIDVNPLILCKDKVVAADALIRMCP